MYIHVKVKTEAKREEVRKVSNDHFEIDLREPAKRNLANKRIIEILEDLFKTRMIRIINGHHSSTKLISIENNE